MKVKQRKHSFFMYFLLKILTKIMIKTKKKFKLTFYVNNNVLNQHH
jgi:hypothetical protein